MKTRLEELRKQYQNLLVALADCKPEDRFDLIQQLSQTSIRISLIENNVVDENESPTDVGVDF